MPKRLPASMRRNGRPSSCAHQTTLRTLIELVRPQMVSMAGSDHARCAGKISAMDVEHINAIGNRLADLTLRTEALRGYL
jgi:hypothetical protein